MITIDKAIAIAMALLFVRSFVISEYEKDGTGSDLCSSFHV
jgi:hypothetical protein